MFEIENRHKIDLRKGKKGGFRVGGCLFSAGKCACNCFQNNLEIE